MIYAYAGFLTAWVGVILYAMREERRFEREEKRREEWKRVERLRREEWEWSRRERE